MRVLSRARIRAQLEAAKSLGWQEFVLEDDNFLLLPDVDQAAILQSLGETGQPWNLDGGLYYPALTEACVHQLRDAGCYSVFLPVESPRLHMMHTSRKYLSLKAASDRNASLRRAATWLCDAGIRFYAAVMVGFPDEGRREIDAAIAFGRIVTRELGAVGCTFHWVHPYPGTELYAESYSLIPPDRRWEHNPEYYTFTKPVFPMRDLSLDDAEKLVNDAFFELNGTCSRNAGSDSWR